MTTHDYLKEMKKIQNNVLGFLDDEANEEENFQNISNLFNNFQILKDIYKFKSLLRLLQNISVYHKRSPRFFRKIDRIFEIFEKEIKKYFSNSEIFNIFKDDKRILLFLLEEKIIEMDKHIINKIVTTEKYLKANYPEYFAPEIKPFMNEEWFPKEAHISSGEKLTDMLKKEIPEYFNAERKNGENENFLCELIRNDSENEFISYVINTNCSLEMTVPPSIYETNKFLIKKQNITLIEYATFHGSFKIFLDLHAEGVKLTQSLWIFAIHGQNTEIIRFLKENLIKSEDESYEQCYLESIKCHHNEMANYIHQNLIKNENENQRNILIQSLKYYNFAFIQENLISKSSFCVLCKYDYYILVNILFNDKSIDINEIDVLKRTI